MPERPDLPEKPGGPMGEPPPPFDTETRQEHTDVDQERMRHLGMRDDDTEGGDVEGSQRDRGGGPDQE